MSNVANKGIIKSMFIMLLITLLVIGLGIYLMPTVHAAEEDVTTWTASGTCEWGIDPDGCLLIRPTDGVSGTLADWHTSSAPWNGAIASVKSVVVKPGVSATTCYRMFNSMTNCTTMDLSGLNTSNVTDMGSMFVNCSSLTSLDVSGFDTSNVTNMHSMFYNCSKLTSLDISGWNTSNVTSMGSMFYGCSALTSLDVSGWDTRNVTNMKEMFSSCSRLKAVIIDDDFRFDGNGITSTRNKAILETPNGSEYTGKWVMLNDTEGTSALTPAEMRDAGSVTPGIWVWQRVDNTFDEYADLVPPAPADPNVTSFNAALLLSQNASVPSATVSFTAAPGAGIAAVPGTSLEVLAPTAENGVTGVPTLGTAAFAASDATVTAVDGVTVGANQKAVVKPVSIDFNGVTFAQPGIFRYLITEPSEGSGLTYDTQLGDSTNGVRYQRVLDVYVQRVDDAEIGTTSYQIAGYVFHEVADAPAVGVDTAAYKSTGFVHEYDTKSITLESRVTGNQSSIDKYFAYTITMQNPNNGIFTVTADWTDAADALHPTANPATKYDTDVITAANTAEWTSNADGSMSKTIYLRNGQKIAIDGIPAGATYAVSVAEEDYGPSWTAGDGSGSTNATGNRVLNAIEDVVFTLTRDGVVPTGVMLSAIPGIVIMAGALIAIIAMRKRKEDQAEA